MNSERPVLVVGGFDDIRSRHLRFLQEASRLGPLTVFLRSDAALQSLSGRPPKFPLAERLYFLAAVRFVSRVEAFEGANVDEPPAVEGLAGGVWVDGACTANAVRQQHARRVGLDYVALGPEQLAGLGEPPPDPAPSNRPKVVVTGCYDWLHSGHVRFFEEASGYGNLHVIVGHDANIRALKGPGHPLLSQQERRYVVGTIRHVHQALISTGEGWLDADPEIQRLKPRFYAVNEDGDRGGKREYCQQHGLEYLVLKRTPAPGLPRRSSTDLRGF